MALLNFFNEIVIEMTLYFPKIENKVNLDGV